MYLFVNINSLPFFHYGSQDGLQGIHRWTSIQIFNQIQTYLASTGKLLMYLHAIP